MPKTVNTVALMNHFIFEWLWLWMAYLSLYTEQNTSRTGKFALFISIYWTKHLQNRKIRPIYLYILKKTPPEQENSPYCFWKEISTQLPHLHRQGRFCLGVPRKFSWCWMGIQNVKRHSDFPEKEQQIRKHESSIKSLFVPIVICWFTLTSIDWYKIQTLCPLVFLSNASCIVDNVCDSQQPGIFEKIAVVAVLRENSSRKWRLNENTLTVCCFERDSTV